MKAGDVVRFKSGSPTMVIVSIHPDASPLTPSGTQMAITTWFDTDRCEFLSDEVYLAALEKVAS